MIHLCTHIRGAFHNDLPGSSGFVFHRNIARTKNIQVADKAIKHNGRTVLSLYQQGVVSSTSYFIVYPLSSFYFPHNFVPYFNFSPPPPPPTEHAVTILNRVSVWLGGTPSPQPLLIPHLIRLLCRPLFSGWRETDPLFGDDRFRYAGVGTPL